MAKKQQFDYDLIVIGSGAGGSAAATLVARAGKKVAIIEADTFGGSSPNWNDVPTKALLHAAQLYDEARHGVRFGLRSATLGYNYPSLRAWKDLAVQRTGAGGNRRYYEQHSISTYSGRVHFISPHEIAVNRRHLSAEYFLIATGATWQKPEIPGIDDINYLTPRTILEAIRPPKTLAIFGADTIGVELAQLMATFGTKVYLFDNAARILPKEDEEVGELMKRLLFEQKGVTSLNHSRILAVAHDRLAKKITYSRGGAEHTLKVEEILVATGLCPEVDMGLENALVEYSQKGITTNTFLQTSSAHIFAAGDVLGTHHNAHSALLQSQTVSHNILHQKNRITPNYTATPRLTFTYPGIASVGLSEDDCIKRDLKIKKIVTPLNIIQRANTSDFRDGFVKLITDEKGVLIGATIVAPHAGEMVHELALAIRHGLLASDVAETPHAFLSWSEAIRIAATRLS